MSGVAIPTRKSMQTLEAVRSVGPGFDPDAWHVMDQRDNALIADEVLNGAGSSKFVYQFPITGSKDPASGISVIGARHLASHYGGLKHRLVGSVQKVGSLFTFTSFPAPQMPMHVQAQSIHELADEPDFYGVVVEITDIKTGNSVQMEKRENRFETNKQGEVYERAHHATIAQSKAYRNGVCALIPQDVQIRWKLEMLKLQKTDVITTDLIAEKRSAVLRFATSKALTVDRPALEALTMDQIAGLSDAARSGGLEVFKASAEALSILSGGDGGPVPVTSRPPAQRGNDAARQQPSRQAQEEPPPPTSHPRDAAPQQQQQRRSPDVPQESTPAAESTPESQFGVYLVDAVGEVVNDGNEFVDAVQFANALEDLLTRAPVGEWTTIVGNNRDAILAAVEASEDAAALIRTIQSGPPSLTVPVPQQRGGKGDAWPPYPKAIREAVLKVPREQLGEWAAANIENIRRAPDVQRLAIVKTVGEYANAIGGTLPPSIAQLVAPAPATEQVRDRDLDFTNDALTQIAALEDLNSHRLWEENTVNKTLMNRFRTERPELFKELRQALDAKRDALSDFPGDRA